MPSTKLPRRDYKRPGHAVARKVHPELAHRRDSGSRNRPATPRGQARNGCAIPFSAPPQTDKASREGGRRSWFQWFSWLGESYSVRLVLIILLPEDLSRFRVFSDTDRLSKRVVEVRGLPGPKIRTWGTHSFWCGQTCATCRHLICRLPPGNARPIRCPARNSSDGTSRWGRGCCRRGDRSPSSRWECPDCGQNRRRWGWSRRSG